MVVNEDDRHGIVLDSGIKAFPRMHNSPICKPFGYVVDLNDMMGAVKRNRKEVFLLTVLPSP